jgi:hypothetical protein
MYTPALARRGNALVLAVAVMAVVAGLILASTDSATREITATVARSQQQVAAAACATVLDRYEAKVIALGNDDPTSLDFPDNFGVDYVGDVRVLWRIEPVRTSALADDQSTNISFIQNPRPGNTGPSVDPIAVPNGVTDPAIVATMEKEAGNDSIWMFRVAAEASTGDRDNPLETDIARAVGARYVAVNKAPLFRYVIFYAQRGPKGDLELTHSGPALIEGDVHANGAIYMGSTAGALDQRAVIGPQSGPGEPLAITAIGRFEGTDTDANGNGIDDTRIVTLDPVTGKPTQKANQRAKVVGVGGVFRLSKALMYAQMNGYPMVAATGPISLRAWQANGSAFDLTTASLPDDIPFGSGESLDLTTVAAATFGGTYVSPFRMLDQAGPIADVLGNDGLRTINGVPLQGFSLLRNDSRSRSGDFIWGKDGLLPYQVTPTVTTPRGFSGYVRSMENGGNPVLLPRLFSQPVPPVAIATSTQFDQLITAGFNFPAHRPFEPQALTYINVDNDVSTDDHLDARPLFINGSGSNAQMPIAGDLIEAPSSFLTFALGQDSSLAMRRIPPTEWATKGTGWEIVNPNALAAAPKDSLRPGLIIRERPVPDTTIFPGTDAVAARTFQAPGAPRYMPYAYGKHWYPTSMPFFVADVSDNLIRANSDAWLNINTESGKNQVQYQQGGTLVVTAANWEGNNRYDGYETNPINISRTRFDEFYVSNPPSTLTDRRRPQHYAERASPSSYAAKTSSRPLRGGWNPHLGLDSNFRARPYAGTAADKTSGTQITANIRWPNTGVDLAVRLPYFYRDNWRFVHLQPGTASVPASTVGSTDGLTRILFDDAVSTPMQTQRISEWTLSAVQPTSSGIDPLSASGTGGTFSFSALHTYLGKVNTDKYSVRWMGYFIPPTTAEYTLAIGPPESASTQRITGGVRVFMPGCETGSGRSITTPVTDYLRDPKSESSIGTDFTPTGVATFGQPWAGYAPDRSTWTTYGATDVLSGASSDSTVTSGRALRHVVRLGVLSSDRAYPIIVDYYSPGTAVSNEIHLNMKSGTEPYAPIKASNLRPWSAASTGFDLNAFKAIEAEIDLPSVQDARTNNDDNQKVGLMIRPAAGVSPQLQGADPYLAILYNPVRGIFTQSRLERAEHVERSLSQRFYIGKGVDKAGALADTTSGEIPDDSMVTPALPSPGRTAYVNRVPVTNLPELIVDYKSTPSNIYTQTVAPSLYTGPMSIIGSDGLTVQILEDFYIGPYTADITKFITKQERKYLKSYAVYEMTAAGYPGLRDGDVGEEFFTFASSTTITPMDNKLIPRTLYSSDSFPPTEQIVGRLYMDKLNGTSSNRRRLTHYVEGEKTWSTPIVEKNSGTETTGSMATIWTSLPIGRNRMPKINFKGNVRTATPADLAYVTGLTFTPDARNEDTVKGYLSAQVAEPSEPPNSAFTGIYDAPTPTAQGTLPTDQDYSFQVARATGGKVPFDINSYITTGMNWLTASPQYVPRPKLTGPTAGAWGSLAAANYPRTGGFRPDAWGRLTTGVAPSAGPTAPNGPYASALQETINSDLWLGGSEMTGPNYNKFPYRATFKDDLSSVASALNAGGKRLRLRIEISGTTATYKYHIASDGDPAPTPADFLTIGATRDIGANFVSNIGGIERILAGVCVQSGDYDNATRAVFRDMKVETTAGTIDSSSWDSQLSQDIARYMASQYQAFWGQRDITESFFTYDAAANGPMGGSTSTTDLPATEEYFLNPRVFWSQSRYWSIRGPTGTLIEKDPVGPSGSTFDNITQRQLAAKTTVLRLNMRAVQSYLKNTTLEKAVERPLTGRTVVPVTTAPTTRLVDLINQNGLLIYTARTNRYPFNPLETQPDDGIKRANPWSMTSLADEGLPNSALAVRDGREPNGRFTDPDRQRLREANAVSLANTWAGPSNTMLFGASNTHKLQPYGLPAVGGPLPVAPPLAPQEFHHGVMIDEAASVDWGYPSATASAYGASKTSIVTSHALYLRGDLNSTKHITQGPGGSVEKITPLAVMGDSITLLSNAWSPDDMQAEGISVTKGAPNIPGQITGAGIVAQVANTFGTDASSTSYNAGIVTNNIPSTKEQVREGQPGSFVGTMLLLENWDRNGAKTDYLGSLVVLDSRRYSDQFLLDKPKSHGTSPFGFTLYQSSDPAQAGDPLWQGLFGALGDRSKRPLSSTDPDWYGASAQVYVPYSRSFTFNEDFRTAAGTPPFTPFGISAAGVGSWLRVIQ